MKKVKTATKSEELTKEELQILENLSTGYSSFSEFSLAMKVERTVLYNTMWRKSGSPATIRKIRKALAKQTQAA